MSEPVLPLVTLRKGEERRLRLGHPWVYSNEVADGLKGLAAGSQVQVVDHRGGPLGVGTANPRTLIAVRLFTRGRKAVDGDLLRRRLETARELRAALDLGGTYRWVYSEGDRLPGLIVDCYGDGLVAQSLTAGVDLLWPEVLAALVELAGPTWVVLRADSPFRALEGVESRVEVAHGRLPEAPLAREGGVEYRFDPFGGQKTGFFLDQRENRARWRRLAAGHPCLDLFCHTGGFALAAAAGGASESLGVDSSEPAVALARESAERNGLTAACRFERADAFDFLRHERRQWPRLNLDPPAFIKSRAKIKAGIAGYQRLNALALARVAPGGLMLTSSCSHHLSDDDFVKLVARAAADVKRPVQILGRFGAAPDHPTLPVLPESAYLKTLLLRVI
ncbi:MAG: class I SAM-dependent rRNA methyltransferase [Nitrospirota bacterium]|jgi:23S rRNA (cytosine1962-C5)-methyltransferase